MTDFKSCPYCYPVRRWDVFQLPCRGPDCQLWIAEADPPDCAHVVMARESMKPPPVCRYQAVVVRTAGNFEAVRIFDCVTGNFVRQEGPR